MKIGHLMTSLLADIGENSPILLILPMILQTFTLMYLHNLVIIYMHIIQEVIMQ